MTTTKITAEQIAAEIAAYDWDIADTGTREDCKVHAARHGWVNLKTATLPCGVRIESGLWFDRDDDVVTVRPMGWDDGCKYCMPEGATLVDADGDEIEDASEAICDLFSEFVDSEAGETLRECALIAVSE